MKHRQAQGRADAGRAAEVLARGHLESAGLTTLASNYLVKGGEIDLLMRDGDCLVVVEVRARRRGAPVGPEESVTPRKVARIVRATETFLARNPRWAERPLRFDLVAIDLDDDTEIRWHRAAFTADDA